MPPRATPISDVPSRAKRAASPDRAMKDCCNGYMCPLAGGNRFVNAADQSADSGNNGRGWRDPCNQPVEGGKDVCAGCIALVMKERGEKDPEDKMLKLYRDGLPLPFAPLNMAQVVCVFKTTCTVCALTQSAADDFGESVNGLTYGA